MLRTQDNKTMADEDIELLDLNADSEDEAQHSKIYSKDTTQQGSINSEEKGNNERITDNDSVTYEGTKEIDNNCKNSDLENKTTLKRTGDEIQRDTKKQHVIDLTGMQLSIK